MKRQLTMAGKWLAGTGGVTALGYLVATEAAGGKHPVWPYWLFGAILVLGLALYIAFQGSGKNDAKSAEDALPPAPAQKGAADDGAVHNEIHGGIFSGPVIQARDITGQTFGTSTPEQEDPGSAR